MTPRYIRKNRRIYAHSRCLHCGTAWGGCPEKECPVTTCLACGTQQCLGNGLGRGQCSVCYVGLLPGWSGTDRQCGYKGCKSKAVAAAPRVGFACVEHLKRSGLDVAIQKQMQVRDSHWMLSDAAKDGGR